MATLQTMLAAARIELLEPRAQKPSYRFLLNVATAAIQNRFNRLSNTGRAWTVGEQPLSVTSGSGDYVISAPNIGKVIDVVAYNADNVEGTERQVVFHDLTDITGDFRGAEYDNLASRIAFYRKDGLDELWAKIRPIPQESATYTVRYAIGEWAGEMASSPLLGQFHGLFTCEIARDAIPAAEWSDDAKADDYKRQSLERSLSRRIETYDREFALHVAAMNTPKITTRLEAYSIDG